MIVRSRARDRGRRRDTLAVLGRWNHDSRVTYLRRCVERDRIVGRVSGHPCDRIVDRLNEVDANGRGIHRRLGQRGSDDHAPSINSTMQRLPASVAASTVLHRSPFAFAHNRPSRAVDDAMDGSSRGDAAACNRERLSGERGVVGGCEIDTHQRQDRPPEAFRLAQGNRKTRRSVNAVSIAQSENVFGAPGRPDGDGRHASVASAESHSVTSPRWTKACSYADQFPTRYFVLYFGWTFDLMSRSCTRSGHRGQRAYSCLVAAEGLCTNAEKRRCRTPPIQWLGSGSPASRATPSSALMTAGRRASRAVSYQAAWSI